MADSLLITPNGNVLYGNVTGNNTSELGIIGLSSLVVGNDSVTSPTPLPSVTADVNFTIGQMIADPVRDMVYVADQTDARVFAVNTDSGSEVASQALPSEPGALAVSVDDNYLYVAEPEAFQIQIFSLPRLTPVNTLDIGLVVNNLVATVNDHLFISTPEVFGASDIDEIDANTGAVLNTLSTQYSSPLPRTNPTGTNLYIQVSAYGGGVDDYDVSGSGQPVKITTYPIGESGDFIVDESSGRLYTTAGGGVGITDLDTKAIASWPLDGPNDSAAIAALPSGPVYCVSGNEIVEFNQGGEVLAECSVPAGVMADSLVITPNGNLLYGNVTANNTSDLGIIGVSSLVIGNDPLAKHVANRHGRRELHHRANDCRPRSR